MQGRAVSANTQSAVTDEQIAAFRTDGAVVLRGPFAEWVETLRAGVARNIASPSPDARVYDGSPGKGRLSATTATGTGFPNSAASSSNRRPRASRRA